MDVKFIRSTLALLGAACSISFFYVSPLHAVDGDPAPAGGASAGGDSSYLRVIAQNTTTILEKINDFPTYASTMVTYALSMTKEDSSEITASLQTKFATVGDTLSANIQSQTDGQAQLNQDLLGADATKDTFPEGNDLLYSTVLGKPLFSPDPRNVAGQPPRANPAYNYIKNAAGYSVTHLRPALAWQGKKYDIRNYQQYYNTVNAVQSYNGYLLSRLYIDNQNGGTLTATQLQLIHDASQSSFNTVVGSEEIGKVLRQLLMFTAQNYVLMTDLVQTQRQLLIAQAMTNTLLIATNISNEFDLANKAQGA